MSPPTRTATRFVARTTQSRTPAATRTALLAHLGPAGIAWLPPTGTAFVTDGVVASVAPEAVAATLASIDRLGDDAPGGAGTGPLAAGALGYSGGEALVVPARIVARDEHGTTWETVVTPATGAPAPAATARPGPTGASRRTAPGRARIVPEPDREAWTAAVRDVLAEIGRGRLRKVVLARRRRVRAARAFDRTAVLTRLATAQPGATVFAVEGFVGASPELLVAVGGDEIRSRPMAGTVARGTNLATDAAHARLLDSAKDRHEHRLVVEAVTAVLAHHGADVAAAPARPVHCASVTHLATEIRARRSDSTGSALGLARALHPTPAVGGTPTDLALAAQRRLEPFPRGRYAGPVGWVDGDGDGEFMLGLRCAELGGPGAVLWAGAGIVAGSEPDAEWAETEAKFEPMLDALLGS